MKINIKTQVLGHYLEVFSRFDRDLLELLAPPVGSLEIVEYTGSRAGDRFHIRFTSPIQADWRGHIVSDSTTSERASFVDVGTVLPWPLRSWTHEHIVHHIDDTQCMIEDSISYTAHGGILMTMIIYPMMYFAFWSRRSGYRAYFDKS